MRNLAKPQTIATLAALSLGASGMGCRADGPPPAEISVAELARLLKTEQPPKVFDANGTSTREEYGVIPGATLLDSSSDYPLDLLPQSKAEGLVFYCASSWCGAAESAARRAMRAGYATVSVLPDGIKGWKRAGMPTTAVGN